MKDPAPKLRQLQSWMQTVITHPGGVIAGAASDDARVRLGNDVAGVEELVTRSQALSGTARLAIYARAYGGRLLDGFRAEYPCLRQALGDQLFSHFVFDYLQSYPSRSYTLNRLSESFPKYLEETRPDAAADSDSRESWPDFIIDLARLERAYLETFDGPGTEQQTCASADELLALSPSDFAAASFVRAPCLRLLTFRYPVANYQRAVKLHADDAPFPDASQTWMGMSRNHYVVSLHDLTFTQFTFLEALQNQTVAEAASTLPGSSATPTPLAEARTWLLNWLDSGFFLSIRVS